MSALPSLAIVYEYLLSETEVPVTHQNLQPSIPQLLQTHSTLRFLAVGVSKQFNQDGANKNVVEVMISKFPLLKQYPRHRMPS
jgi:hypothetical protein